MLAKVFGWIVGAPRVSSMEDGECRSGRNVDSIHFLVCESVVVVNLSKETMRYAFVSFSSEFSAFSSLFLL